MRLFIIFFLTLYVSGCATYVIEPKVDATSVHTSNGVLLINGNTDKEPRIYFSDGITTLKARYSTWAEYLLNAYASRAKKDKLNLGKSIEISILSISCSGSFLTNCTVIISASTKAGQKEVFATETVYGYGAQQTTEKALDEIATMIEKSTLINDYIFQN